MYTPVGLSPIITTVIQINKLTDKQKSLNIGHISYMTVDDACGYVKDACRLNPKAASKLTTLFIH